MSSGPGGKKTPLYEVHNARKAKMVNFNGWDLPVQYQGIIEEVKATRQRASLFDVSHMGEIKIEDSESEEFLQRLLTNDVSKLSPGKAQYTLLCNNNGGIVDDLLVFRLGEKSFWLIVNAANIDKDLSWLKDNVQEQERVEIVDESNEFALIALQGPKAGEILSDLITNYNSDLNVDDLANFSFKKTKISDIDLLISRTGYTGEDGFELFLPAEKGEKIWLLLEEVGEKYGLALAGLGARDVLRLEAALPLYGQELSEDITPLQAGLSSFVKFNKFFIGKEELEKQKEEGIKKKLIGFEMEGKRAGRNGYELYDQDNKVGVVTSGSFSPTIGKPIGLGYVSKAKAVIGNELKVKIRNKLEDARIVKIPFYRRG